MMIVISEGHFNERHMDIWIEKWGTLRLGQGDTATNGTSEVDLSGTAVAAYSSVADVGGGFEFRDNGDIGITVRDSRSNFDGLSRKDRVRYDTPRWAGFFASGSRGQQRSGIWQSAMPAISAGPDLPLPGGGPTSALQVTVMTAPDWEFSSSASILFDFGLELHGFVCICGTGQQESMESFRQNRL